MAKKFFEANIQFYLWIVLIVVLVAGCTPDNSADPVTSTREGGIVTAEVADSGWCVGGPNVLTPEDAGCYLEGIDPEMVQWVDGETALLLPTDEAVGNWAGAAILYHSGTNSIMVFDMFGDNLPQASVFSSRAGAAVFEALSWDEDLMVGVKSQIQARWQTTAPNQPEIRLGIAWQDGRTTIFLVAIAGLDATDDRFYCPSQKWTIDDIEVHILPECITHEPGTPVSQIFFQPHEIEGGATKSVQVELDSVASNIVLVNGMDESMETAVYEAVLSHLTGRSVVIQSETVPGFEEDGDLPPAEVDRSLWGQYLTINETPASLRFLFQNSSRYFVQPGEVIQRDYLPGEDIGAACTFFRGDYPGLGGVVNLSQIGLSDDGAKALVHAELACGTADRLAFYYILENDGGGWQVINSIEASVELSVLVPSLVYTNQAEGCGDFFVYKSNNGRSEFILASVDTSAFPLSAEPLRLDLASHSEGLQVRIEVYSDAVNKLGEFPYCNDVGPTARPQSMWQAESGFMTVTAGFEIPPVEPCEGELYPVNILLEELTFRLGEETVFLPSLSFDNVTVGWCSG